MLSAASILIPCSQFANRLTPIVPFNHIFPTVDALGLDSFKVLLHTCLQQRSHKHKGFNESDTVVFNIQERYYCFINHDDDFSL